MEELVTIVAGGVPVNAAATGVDLERAVQRSAQCHRAFASNPEEKRGEHKTSEMRSATEISRARTPESKSITVGVFVTHRVRIINGFFLAGQSREETGGLNRDADRDTVPHCLCAQALPKFLDDLVPLRKKIPWRNDTDE